MDPKGSKNYNLFITLILLKGQNTVLKRPVLLFPFLTFNPAAKCSSWIKDFPSKKSTPNHSKGRKTSKKKIILLSLQNPNFSQKKYKDIHGDNDYILFYISYTKGKTAWVIH